MRALALMAVLTLGACAAGGGAGSAGRGSYQLESGSADYDALQRATTLCRSRGGALQPRRDADLTELSDYTCVIPKGAK